MAGHVDGHRRVVAGDQTRGGGFAGGDLDGAAQHEKHAVGSYSKLAKWPIWQDQLGRLGSPEEASATSRSGGRSSGVVGGA